MNRNALIKLIHIGKREMGLDEETYRAMLGGITNKTSCAQLSDRELETVFNTMQDKGFKPRLNGNPKVFKRRQIPKSGRAKHAEIDKIRAIWLEMARHGFVKDKSEAALDAYVRRMSNRRSNQGVDHVAWCTAELAYQVLEALKSWHRRVMIDGLTQAGWTVPINERTGKPMGYDHIAYAYNEMLSAKLRGKR
ncbi:gp16 family protein [Vibrio cholerae]|uniref:gp16 family protein n=1 Tax=Vibrio cholerae TaxID=666 RepID=UPI001C2FD5B9